MLDRIFGFIDGLGDSSFVGFYITGKAIAYWYYGLLWANGFYLVAAMIDIYKSYFNDSSSVRFRLFIAFVLASLMEYYNTTHESLKLNMVSMV